MIQELIKFLNDNKIIIWVVFIICLNYFLIGVWLKMRKTKRELEEKNPESVIEVKYKPSLGFKLKDGIRNTTISVMRKQIKEYSITKEELFND